ncbi:hypothetical protein WJX81_007836 [Elliptochloris bilobata]|uniref:Dynein axonemal intermediate chain 4 n=1 Tax=Elliptochloris bilobata TaxID=381761 RepID=A0AAW1SCM1_9CHLO
MPAGRGSAAFSVAPSMAPDRFPGTAGGKYLRSTIGRPDILAAGYVQHTFGAPGGGLIALWSLKNTGAPLWAAATGAGVASLDWAAEAAGLLAVGQMDGTVAVYDVRARQAAPVMAAGRGSGGHEDPAWHVRWVARGPERGEALVSISTDGRVTQWATSKGLEPTDLMRLKRVPPAPPTLSGGKPLGPSGGGGAAAPEPFISRHAGGMCFDFSGLDGRAYLVGTEEGAIHLCSTSYAEQYGASFAGHLGPATALLAFQTGCDEVADAAWCPSNATAFAAVTAGGRVEVWDIASSVHRPAAAFAAAEDAAMTCLAFAPTAPILAAGGTAGCIAAFRLHGVPREGESPGDAVMRLEAALAANTVRRVPGG